MQEAFVDISYLDGRGTADAGRAGHWAGARWTWLWPQRWLGRSPSARALGRVLNGDRLVSPVPSFSRILKSQNVEFPWRSERKRPSGLWNNLPLQMTGCAASQRGKESRLYGDEAGIPLFAAAEIQWSQLKVQLGLLVEFSTVSALLLTGILKLLSLLLMILSKCCRVAVML